MGIYRTAQGRPLDMAQLAAKNEKTRAVGNMNVNARGDTIDSHGKIITPVTRKVGNRYSNSVTNPESNRAKSLVRKKTDVSPDDVTEVTKVEPVESIFEEMTDEDLEFLEPSDEDLEIEEIKAQEVEKAKKK